MSLMAITLRKSLDFKGIIIQLGLEMSSSLDIGSGSKPRNPFGANSVFGVVIRLMM